MKRNVCLVIMILVLGVFVNLASALDQTSTGFYYPIGEEKFDSKKGWWLSKDPDYFTGKYHVGVDMMTYTHDPEKEDSHIYAIADGKIIYVSYDKTKDGSMWGIGNCALAVEHRKSDGSIFMAIYGHLSNDSIPSNPSVRAGRLIGKTGYWEYGDHLHFSIHDGSWESMAKSGWGRMSIDRWPDQNTFTNPISFIESNSPASCQPQEVVSQINYFWVANPFSNQCEHGLTHYRIQEGPNQCSMFPVSALEACAAVKVACQNSARIVNTDSRLVKFIKSILGQKADASNDFPYSDLATMCDQTLVQANFCLSDNAIQVGFEKDSQSVASDISVFKPNLSSKLKIKKIGICDDGNTNHQHSLEKEPSSSYHIYIQLENKDPTPANNIEIRYYISKDKNFGDSDDEYIASDWVDSIEGNTIHEDWKNKKNKKRIKTPENLGEYFIYAVIINHSNKTGDISDNDDKDEYAKLKIKNYVPPPPPMEIKLKAPKGGDKWKTDKTQTIKWDTNNVPKGTHVKIEYTLDANNWHTITESTKNDGSKKWDMRDSPFKNLIKKDTDKAKIRITVIEYPKVKAETGRFKIDYKKKQEKKKKSKKKKKK